MRNGALQLWFLPSEDVFRALVPSEHGVADVEKDMTHILKAMLIAGVLGTGAFLTAPTADAQYYSRPSVSVYIGVDGRRHYRDREYYRHRYYSRSYYRDRCHRWNRWERYNCGRHYGWRNHWRRSAYRSW